MARTFFYPGYPGNYRPRPVNILKTRLANMLKDITQTELQGDCTATPWFCCQTLRRAQSSTHPL